MKDSCIKGLENFFVSSHIAKLMLLTHIAIWMLLAFLPMQSTSSQPSAARKFKLTAPSLVSAPKPTDADEVAMLGRTSTRDLHEKLKAKRREVIALARGDDPKAVVSGLVMYCLYLTSIYSSVHKSDGHLIVIREAAANTTPEFLLALVDGFREALKRHLVDRASTKQHLHRNAAFIVEDPESVLCLQRLLDETRAHQDFRHIEEKICDRFCEAQRTINKFLVAYTLVKRLTDVIYSVHVDYAERKVDSEIRHMGDAIRGVTTVAARKLGSDILSIWDIPG